MIRSHILYEYKNPFFVFFINTTIVPPIQPPKRRCEVSNQRLRQKKLLNWNKKWNFNKNSILQKHIETSSTINKASPPGKIVRNKNEKNKRNIHIFSPVPHVCGSFSLSSQSNGNSTLGSSLIYLKPKKATKKNTIK